MTSAEQIARRLTKAQMNWALGRRRLDSGPGMWPLRHALYKLGLVEGLNASLTPLGLEVRKILESRHDH